MKNKKLWVVIIVLIIIGGFIYIKFWAPETKEASVVSTQISETSIPVETIKVTNQQMDSYTAYVGVVRPMPLQEISFDTIETIERVYVKQGQLIKQGDPILKIEVSNADDDLIEDLFDQLSKRDDAYDDKEEVKEEFEDAEEDDDDYDDLKDEYAYLQEVYTLEKQEYEKLKQECTVYFVFCEMDGYVAEVSVKRGTYAYPHQTLIKLGFEKSAVVIGVPSDIIDKIAVGQEITIEVDEVETAGEVFDIADLPNPESNTYQVSISYDTESSNLQIGEVVTATLRSGREEGIAIPINTILNDGNDYVYVVIDNVANKKYIQVESVVNDLALVKGINPQDEVVSKGMKNIQSGSNLDIITVY